MSKSKTNDDLVEAMAASGADPSDQLWLAVQMMDHTKIIQALQHHALMLKMEMATSNPLADLAYIVMRIAKPHLFEDES